MFLFATEYFARDLILKVNYCA